MDDAQGQRQCPQDVGKVERVRRKLEQKGSGTQFVARPGIADSNRDPDANPDQAGKSDENHRTVRGHFRAPASWIDRRSRVMARWHAVNSSLKVTSVVLLLAVAHGGRFIQGGHVEEEHGLWIEHSPFGAYHDNAAPPAPHLLFRKMVTPRIHGRVEPLCLAVATTSAPAVVLAPFDRHVPPALSIL
jgi:hypothetical protein